MKETIKTIIIYSVAILVMVIASYFYNNSKKGKLLETMENTLHSYFENNNMHIAAHDFSIDDVKIRCIGNKAYVVQFDILLNDENARSLNALEATVYKENDEWNVKGFNSGITSAEKKSYNFKCYN